MALQPTVTDDQKQPLVLSGNVYVKDEVDLLALAEEDPESLPDLIREDVAGSERLSSGDLKVYPQLDAQGRMAVRGGHTNHGYSGYFAASIFDGVSWRRFDLRTIVPVEESGFAAQKDKGAALDRIRERVASARGRQCVWGVAEEGKQMRYGAVPPR
jgi:hypothetical protein